ncbi:MAG: ATP-dependent DNA helicase [Polyangiaceae bacterium]|nr:ATP-dependent DNA helicase [Polyangiaceae bacterium]
MTPPSAGAVSPRTKLSAGDHKPGWSTGPAAVAVAALGPDGPLARAFAGYEARPGQLEMASAVAEALADDQILLVEAGTGTGKTLAYLVPAVQSGRKVVVSTATRALEEQILKSDLPLVAHALGLQPSVAVMKGLGNYLCRRRYRDLAATADPNSPRLSRSLRIIDQWLERTTSGDVAELVDLPEDDPILAQITASSDTRIGHQCPHHEECFVTRMRRAAERARLVVVNHHLFFADLALRGPHPGRVIPDYDAVIFDEAHQLEDIATTFFGVRVSRPRIAVLARDAAQGLARARALEPGLVPRSSSALAEDVEPASATFFAALAVAVGQGEGRVAVERDLWCGDLRSRWLDLDRVLEGLGALATLVATALRDRDPAMSGTARSVADVLEVVARRAELLRDQLAAIVDTGRGLVAWFEPDPSRPALSAAPVDLAALFRTQVFERIPSVVLTSATLTTGHRAVVVGSDGIALTADAPPSGGSRGDFGYLRGRLGLADPGLSVMEAVVESPFDFAGSVLLYLPRDLPAPGDAGFAAAAIRRIADLVAATGGGAFVLTTSLRSLRQLGAGLRAALPECRVLVQGDAPKSALIGEFRGTEDAVLVATMGFWEGVDVPGRALRLVVLEKVPFAVPTDPVVRARALALERDGKNPFVDLFVPAAAITLKQGFGRLVRTRRDRGIVALLDGRVTSRGYGRRLLDALPPARRTTELSTVREFAASMLV